MPAQPQHIVPIKVKMTSIHLCVGTVASGHVGEGEDEGSGEEGNESNNESPNASDNNQNSDSDYIPRRNEDVSSSSDDNTNLRRTAPLVMVTTTKCKCRRPQPGILRVHVQSVSEQLEVEGDR